MLLEASAVNAYMGAWITAGIAVGGVVFSALQGIASAILKFKIHKNDNEVKIKIESEKNKQLKIKRKEEKISRIRLAFNNYLSTTITSIYQEQQLPEQLNAYSAILEYVDKIGFNSTIWDIQEAIKHESFTAADDKFHKYLPKLKELEN